MTTKTLIHKGLSVFLSAAMALSIPVPGFAADPALLETAGSELPGVDPADAPSNDPDTSSQPETSTDFMNEANALSAPASGPKIPEEPFKSIGLLSELTGGSRITLGFDGQTYTLSYEYRYNGRTYSTTKRTGELSVDADGRIHIIAKDTTAAGRNWDAVIAEVNGRFSMTSFAEETKSEYPQYGYSSRYRTESQFTHGTGRLERRKSESTYQSQGYGGEYYDVSEYEYLADGTALRSGVSAGLNTYNGTVSYSGSYFLSERSEYSNSGLKLSYASVYGGGEFKNVYEELRRILASGSVKEGRSVVDASAGLKTEVYYKTMKQDYMQTDFTLYSRKDAQGVFQPAYLTLGSDWKYAYIVLEKVPGAHPRNYKLQKFEQGQQVSAVVTREDGTRETAEFTAYYSALYKGNDLAGTGGNREGMPEGYGITLYGKWSRDKGSEQYHIPYPPETRFELRGELKEMRVLDTGKIEIRDAETEQPAKLFLKNVKTLQDGLIEDYYALLSGALEHDAHPLTPEEIAVLAQNLGMGSEEKEALEMLARYAAALREGLEKAQSGEYYEIPADVAAFMQERGLPGIPAVLLFDIPDIDAMTEEDAGRLRAEIIDALNGASPEIYFENAANEAAGGFARLGEALEDVSEKQRNLMTEYVHKIAGALSLGFDIDLDGDADAADTSGVLLAYDYVLGKEISIEASAAQILDRDRDGQITDSDRSRILAEIAGLKENIERAEMFAESLGSDSFSYDFDANGVLDSNDFNYAKTAFENLLAVRSYLSDETALNADLNGDALVNQEDLSLLISRMQETVEGIKKAAAFAAVILSDTFDFDRDGKLSAADIESAAASFKEALTVLAYLAGDTAAALDRDQNGRIDDGDLAILMEEIRDAVEALNHPPEALGAEVELDEDGSLMIYLQASDADGDRLEYSITGVPAHGRLSEIMLDANGEAYVLYTPAEHYNGADEFSFRVSDGRETSSPASVKITVAAVNDAPSAVPSEFTIEEDSQNVRGVLTGSDADNGDVLKFELVKFDGPGKLELSEDGSYAFIPEENFNGTVEWFFVVTDGKEYSEPARVIAAVTPVNDAPVMEALEPVESPEGTEIRIQAKASDPDNDGLVYGLRGISETAGLPQGLKIDPDTGMIVWFASYQQAGSYEIIVTASDPMGEEAAQVLLITVTDAIDPSMLQKIIAFSEGMRSDRFDPDGTGRIDGTDLNLAGLTYDLVLANAPLLEEDLLAVFDFDGNGITDADDRDAYLSFLQEGMTRLASAEEFLLLLARGTDGTVNADLDRSGAIDGNDIALVLTRFDVEIIKYASPNAKVLADFNADGMISGADKEALIAYIKKAMEEKDPPEAHAQSAALEEDGMIEIRLTGTTSTGNISFILESEPAHGHIEGFNAGAGTLKFIPDENFNGSVSFRFKVSDGDRLSEAAEVAITVEPVNDAPVMQSIPEQSFREGSELNIGPIVSDIEGDALSFVLELKDLQGVSLDPGALGIEFDAATGQLFWRPEAGSGHTGEYEAEIIAWETDTEEMLSASGSFRIILREAPAGGAGTPFDDPSKPVNGVYWDLSQVLDAAGTKGVSGLRLLRKDPKGGDFREIASLDPLTARYMDEEITADLSPLYSYSYKLEVVRSDGTFFNVIPHSVKRFNQELELKPENLIVIASSNANTTRGKGAAVMDDAVDLVEYYREQRGVPSANIVRLNTLNDDYYTYEDFKTKILMPLYQHLTANNLTEKAYALTTMPGAHFFVNVNGQRTPAESVIATLLPLLIRGENLPANLSTTYADSDKGNEFDIFKAGLGYTRLQAPATASLSAKENLKRMIDQGIQAEREAAAAREAGVTADHYVHLIDARGLNPAPGGYNYGDLRFRSAAELLKEHGYTVYVDNKSAWLSESNPITDQELIDDLKSGEKELKGYGGWYFPGSQNTVYDYIESVASFGKGSYITPLDSYYAPGWDGLKRDGVTMATNAQFEPYVTGLAETVGAFVYTGTPLAFAAVMSAKVLRWASNIYGDPLYNIGKYIVDKVKDVVDAAGNLLGTRETADTGSMIRDAVKKENGKTDGSYALDYMSGERKNQVEIVRDLEGRVVSAKVGPGEEIYAEDGSMIFRGTNDSVKYFYNAGGRIIREERMTWITDSRGVGRNEIFAREFLFTDEGTARGFLSYNPDGTLEGEYDLSGKRIVRDEAGDVVKAVYFSGTVWPPSSSRRVTREVFFTEGRAERIDDHNLRYLEVSPGKWEQRTEIYSRYLSYDANNRIVSVQSENQDGSERTVSTFDTPLGGLELPGEALVFEPVSRIESVIAFSNLFDFLSRLTAWETDTGRTALAAVTLQRFEEEGHTLPLGYRLRFDSPEEGKPGSPVNGGTDGSRSSGFKVSVLKADGTAVSSYQVLSVYSRAAKDGLVLEIFNLETSNHVFGYAYDTGLEKYLLVYEILDGVKTCRELTYCA